MATVKPKVTAPVTTPAPAPQTLPTTGLEGSMPMSALASPYDGTNPALGGTPIMGTGTTPIMGAAQAGMQAGRPQVNATNQTALAPNGNVNQTVTNENQYTNKYYNIIVPSSGFGGIGGGIGGMFGGWNQPGNSFIDPKTGVLYVQKDTGIGGWFKRLFRGY